MVEPALRPGPRTAPDARRAAVPSAWIAAWHERGAPWANDLAAAGERALALEGAGTVPSAGVGAAFGVAVEGRHAAILHGELFEVPALAGRLALDPAAVGRTGDGAARLLLAAFRRWGEELAAHVNGRFAGLLFDGATGSLLAVRDRVGFVPLYFRRDGALWRFAVDAESLAAAAPRRGPDPRTVAGMLGHVLPELDETFYEGVRRVPPGHLARLAEDGLRVRRHWRPAPVGEGAAWVRPAELPRFGELLDQAVGRATDAGPSALFLSGGLDSVSVAAASVERARRAGADAPLALSLLFPGEVREEAVQRGVARELGMEFAALELREALEGRGLLQAGLELSRREPTPLQNVWAPAYERLAAEAGARGRRAVLTGGGGDEWLTVTPLIAADYLRHGRLGALARYMAALHRSLHLPTRALARNVLWTNGALPLARRAYRRSFARLAPARWNRRIERGALTRAAAIPRWVAPEPGLRLELEQRAADRVRQHADPAPLGPGGHYFREMAVTLDHPLFAIDIEEIFSLSGASGMPQYDIYWDPDLIEFLYRVPPDLLNRGGRSKGMVRDDLARRFPGLGFERQRKLLSRDFFSDTILSEAPDAWRALGGVPALAGLGVITPRGADDLVREVVSHADARRVDDLWRLMSLEAWARPRLAST